MCAEEEEEMGEKEWLSFHRYLFFFLCVLTLYWLVLFEPHSS
jgi:hypothetical protein